MYFAVKMKQFSVLITVLIVSFVVAEDQIVERIGNTIYLISQGKRLTWDDANKYCEDKDMKLLSLQTREKNEELNTALLKLGFVDTSETGLDYLYWTSGNDIKEEGKFVWESTGEKFTYTNWLPTMPDNWRKDEHCVTMGWRELGKWNDDRCYYHRHFICERDVSANSKGTIV